MIASFWRKPGLSAIRWVVAASAWGLACRDEQTLRQPFAKNQNGSAE
jgi:hypothetical protein